LWPRGHNSALLSCPPPWVARILAREGVIPAFPRILTQRRGDLEIEQFPRLQFGSFRDLAENTNWSLDLSLKAYCLPPLATPRAPSCGSPTASAPSPA
jgi:hypothetical protein